LIDKSAPNWRSSAPDPAGELTGPIGREGRKDGREWEGRREWTYS